MLKELRQLAGLTAVDFMGVTAVKYLGAVEAVREEFLIGLNDKGRRHRAFLSPIIQAWE